MKNIFCCSLLFVAFKIYAQDNKPYDMTINGVKVIVVPSGNEIIQINLVIKGGVQNYSTDKQGIEKLAMRALTECGTEKDDKNSFKNKLDEVDAKINGYAQKDASYFGLNCIKTDLEAVWPLYVDALTIPKFDTKEFNRIREDAINDIREEDSDPDADLDKMAMQTAFKGRDYAKSPSGTIDNLKKFTPEETKNYFKSILTRSRIFMVVVGDISKDDLQQKLTGLINKIPEGKPFELKREIYSPQANSFVAKPKDVATNYIMGISSAPASNSKEYLPSALASEMFYNKIFLEVRTKNGLSYAPAGFISTGLTPYSLLYVTTKEPNAYIAVARNTVDNLKKNGFPADDVKNTKTTYSTYQYYQNETNSSLCNFVGFAELQFGDWHRAFTLKEDLQPITPAQVNAVFNKYVGNFTWVYQGDPKQVNQTLFTQKETPPPPAPKKAF
jgi:predicted Zn-dependent peptidase